MVYQTGPSIFNKGTLLVSIAIVMPFPSQKLDYTKEKRPTNCWSITIHVRRLCPTPGNLLCTKRVFTQNSNRWISRETYGERVVSKKKIDTRYTYLYTYMSSMRFPVSFPVSQSVLSEWYQCDQDSGADAGVALGKHVAKIPSQLGSATSGVGLMWFPWPWGYPKNGGFIRFIRENPIKIWMIYGIHVPRAGDFDHHPNKY